MNRLWLTYAWSDNRDQSIDYIRQELQKLELEVSLDRYNLSPGMRLWPQIAEQITQPDKCDAWAMLISARSLESEPCKEELYYALQRTLDEKDDNFPLIGIIDDDVNMRDIPTVLRSRLCVSLRDPNWAEAVCAGVRREAPPDNAEWISPYITEARYDSWNRSWYEFRPRVGTLERPFVFALSENSSSQIFADLICCAPPNYPPENGAMGEFPPIQNFRGGKIVSSNQMLSSQQSFWVPIAERPHYLCFGRRLRNNQFEVCEVVINEHDINFDLNG